MINSTTPDSIDGVFPYSANELKSKNTNSYTSQESAEKKELRQALKNSQKRYAIATEIISDGLWEWNLKSGTICYSDRWKSTIGCNDGQIINSPSEWLNRVHPEDFKRLKHNLTACRQGKIARFEIEYRMLHQDRQYRSMYCRCAAVTDAKGKVSHLIGSQVNIRQRYIEAKANDLVLYDCLTNLPNRQLFIKKLEQLSRSNLEPGLVGILCLDLDRFKDINRDFGHLIGDRLLVEIVLKLETCLQSNRLLRHTRLKSTGFPRQSDTDAGCENQLPTLEVTPGKADLEMCNDTETTRTQIVARDSIARLGSDEFAILLTGFTNPEYPTELAARIQQEFSEPIKVKNEVKNRSILVSLSIGIALPTRLNEHFEQNISHSPLECLQNAEIAMQQAKAKGQARNVIFESTVHLQNMKKSKSEDELRKAIEQEQFELYYQPIFRLEDRHLVGFEALIRWRHPVRGLISPAEFIPLAEDTGLIMPIGWWVLRSACGQMRQWHQKHSADSLFISVNITGKQFSQPYAADMIAQTIQETGLDPRYLKLEITESEIIENINLVLPTVEQLKSLGIQLSMDDFGTGYSSLSYLHFLQIDTLKIDRCFIQGIESDLQKLELVRTIINLAEVFELDVVAEGIETEQHYSQLLDLQCKHGQGFLFHKPLSVAMATDLLVGAFRETPLLSESRIKLE